MIEIKEGKGDTGSGITRADGTNRDESSVVRSLSPREWQVVECLARGLQQKDIAAELNVSINTAREHLRRIYRKTGKHNGREVTRWYLVGAASLPIQQTGRTTSAQHPAKGPLM